MSSSDHGPGRPSGAATTGGGAAGRPREVDASFWLWIAGVMVALISTALSVVQLDALVAASVEATDQIDPAADPAAVEQAATVGAIVGLVIALALVVAQLVLALLMRRGRNWARILLAVLAVLTVLLLPLSIPTSPTLVLVPNVVYTLLAVVAAVVMYLPRARPWFRQPT